MKAKGQELLAEFIAKEMYPDETLPEYKILAVEIGFMDDACWQILFVTDLPDNTFYLVKWTQDQSEFNITSFSKTDDEESKED